MHTCMHACIIVSALFPNVTIYQREQCTLDLIMCIYMCMDVYICSYIYIHMHIYTHICDLPRILWI